MFFLIFLLFFYPASALCNSSFTTLFSGGLNSIFGKVSQNSSFKKNAEDEKYKTSNLSNSGSFSINSYRKINDITHYGIYLKLKTSIASIDKKGFAKRGKLYYQGRYGKIELGNGLGAVGALSVDSYTNSYGTGGLDGDWSDFLPEGLAIVDKYDLSDAFLTRPDLPIGSSDGVNKINYFSPKIGNFRFGITYIPDSESKGPISSSVAQKSSNKIAYRNILQTNLLYKIELFKKITFSTSLSGEFGSAKSINSTDRNNLKAFKIGSMLSSDNISIALSYGNAGKSGVIKSSIYNKNYYYSIGSAYFNEDFGVSLEYMKSKSSSPIAEVDVIHNEPNKFSAISLGTEYVIKKGFAVYGEITNFIAYKNNNFSSLGEAKFNKGSVFLLGTKLVF